MCFYIDKKYPKEKTAKRNIVCHKVGNMHFESKESFFSMHFNFQYELNVRTQKIKLSIKNYGAEYFSGIGDIGIIKKGYHSFRSKEKAIEIMNITLYKNKIVLAKCYIPKGAKYYYDPVAEEYVSDSITPLKIIAERKNITSKIIEYN